MNVKAPAKEFRIQLSLHGLSNDRSRPLCSICIGLLCCMASFMSALYAQGDRYQDMEEQYIPTQRTEKNSRSPLLFPFSAVPSTETPAVGTTDKKAAKKRPLIINVSPETEEEPEAVKTNTSTKKEEAAQLEAQRAEEKARKEQEEAQRERERELFWKQYAPTRQETLEIVVVDQATGKYIPEARVTVASLKQLPNSKIFSEDEVAIGFTNSKGKYRAEGVSEGYYVVRISGLPGYTDTEEYTTVHPEKITVIGIKVPPREE